MIRLPRWRRRIHYVRQLRQLPVGTLLTFPGSSVAASLMPDGWLVTGVAGTRDDLALAGNLPARLERRGTGPVRDLHRRPRPATTPTTRLPLSDQTVADLMEVFRK